MGTDVDDVGEEEEEDDDDDEDVRRFSIEKLDFLQGFVWFCWLDDEDIVESESDAVVDSLVHDEDEDDDEDDKFSIQKKIRKN